MMEGNWSLNGSANLSLNSMHEQDRNSSGQSTANWYDLYYEEYNELDNTYTVTSVDVISIVLCILGIVANIVSINMVIRLHQKLSTHLKLIISLCCSDCLILIPTFLSKVFLMTHEINLCFNVAVRLVTDLALLATLLNLLAIAADHYLAILRPLMYKKQMTNIRGMIAVLVIWFVSVLAIAVEIIMGIAHQREMEPLCEAIAYDKVNSELGIVIFIFIVLLVIFVIYGRIYICVVRNRSIHSETRHRQKETSNIKALVTTSLFVLTFVFFWTPIGIFNVYLYNKDNMYILNNLEKIEQIGDILYVILLLNAIADPIIYTFRLPQIQRKCFIFRTTMRRQSTKTSTLTSELQDLKKPLR
ncbi:adrenocorticotropic hormone receptor-like [Ruditapes philippinarum]|uniref:adrenocorticotropic hormone receptor-like n=1 Tax=Ruditapes philippinarum TaxID=129788 RepID=UPI00295B388B|nr:adrenocorticotropic hormone receptor-like [Ruditapes philippinarum]